MIKRILAGLLALPLLAACTPDSTPPPKVDHTINFEVAVYAASGTFVSADVRLDAVTADKSTYRPSDEPSSYPVQAHVDLPWSHTIRYKDPVAVRAMLTVMNVMLAPGDSITCIVRVDGKTPNPMVEYKNQTNKTGTAQITCQGSLV